MKKIVAVIEKGGEDGYSVYAADDSVPVVGSGLTEQEARLAAVLAEVEGAGNVSVLIAQEAGSPVSAVVLFDGTDGILVRLRLTQITAQALNIAENKVLVCPAEVRK